MNAVEPQEERVAAQLRVAFEHTHELEAEIVRAHRASTASTDDARAEARRWKEEATRWRDDAEALRASTSYRFGHAVVRPLDLLRRSIRRAGR